MSNFAHSSSDESISTSVVDHVEADELLDKAVRTDVKGQPIEDKGQVRRDGQWDAFATSDPDRTVSHSGRHGESLEMQERREAREAELAHQRERAVNTFGEEEADRRAEECRESVRAQSEVRGRSTYTDSRHHEVRTDNYTPDNTLDARIERTVELTDIGLARGSGTQNKAQSDTIEARQQKVSSDSMITWIPPMGRWDVESDATGWVPDDDTEAFWGLDKDTLADVRKAGEQLADHFEDEPTTIHDPVGYARLVARRVARGSDVFSATMNTQEWIEAGIPGVVQDISDINPYEQGRATVEVEVIKLWKPKNASQRQCGLVTDGSCEPVKFTIWQKSGADFLIREGDTLRVEQAAINAYNGNTTLTVIGDTSIIKQERGDGSYTHRGNGQEDVEPPTWSADSDQHAWLNKIDMDRAIPATKRSMNE